MHLSLGHMAAMICTQTRRMRLRRFMRLERAVRGIVIAIYVASLLGIFGVTFILLLVVASFAIGMPPRVSRVVAAGIVAAAMVTAIVVTALWAEFLWRSHPRSTRRRIPATATAGLDQRRVRNRRSRMRWRRPWVSGGLVFAIGMITFIFLPNSYVKIKMVLLLVCFASPIVSLPQAFCIGVRLWRRRRARHRWERGLCPRCGYNVVGLGTRSRCPECGLRLAPRSLPK
jgi:hypothetical protein